MGSSARLAGPTRHRTWTMVAALLGIVGIVATLVAAGSFDGIAPVANASALAEQIPGARMQVFEGGHGFLLQDPQAWPAIAEFVRAGHESASAAS